MIINIAANMELHGTDIEVFTNSKCLGKRRREEYQKEERSFKRTRLDAFQSITENDQKVNALKSSNEVYNEEEQARGRNIHMNIREMPSRKVNELKSSNEKLSRLRQMWARNIAELHESMRKMTSLKVLPMKWRCEKYQEKERNPTLRGPLPSLPVSECISFGLIESVFNGEALMALSKDRFKMKSYREEDQYGGMFEHVLCHITEDKIVAKEVYQPILTRKFEQKQSFTRKKSKDIDYNKADDRKELQELEHLLKCKVCLDKDSCMIFFPCRHMATCESCEGFLQRCPVCRSPINESVKINED